jgi:hypothetical protein
MTVHPKLYTPNAGVADHGVRMLQELLERTRVKARLGEHFGFLAAVQRGSSSAGMVLGSNFTEIWGFYGVGVQCLRAW